MVEFFLILIILFIILDMRIIKMLGSNAGCNIKPKTNEKRPDVLPAPQKPIKNKKK